MAFGYQILGFGSGAKAAPQSYAIDFLSNGFIIRHSDAAYNGNGDYYIYGAFGKVPEVTAGGVPATAR